ncbi:unnamed protein product [Rangifer tarandus platyrhynchus]|uniref:Uncharacterized protein n=1 Tax=Rangifer tarandus platyrhynchus TaxID=3082113 RepID=A0ABN8ZD94_RANTA|nr:unnamed protein product [Rangifer tarandus platyrhynchus]
MASAQARKLAAAGGSAPQPASPVGLSSPVRTAWLLGGDPGGLWQEGGGRGRRTGRGRDSFLRQHRFPPAGLSDCSDSSADEIHETKKDFLIL